MPPFPLADADDDEPGAGHARTLDQKLAKQQAGLFRPSEFRENKIEYEGKYVGFVE